MRQPLKPIHEIMERDQRNWGFVILNTETGDERPYTLEDLHSDIRKVKLSRSVPKKIREQFDIVLNLMLYSWFVYDFSSSAFMLANATVEMALIHRCEEEDGVKIKRSPGLRKMLKRAVNSGWIVDGDFSHLDQSKHDPKGTKYCKTLPKVMSCLRNSLAHGSSFLSSPMQIVGTVDINAHLINALFDKKAD